MRRIVVATVLFAVLAGTIAFLAPAPTTAAEPLKGRDTSCFDRKPGRGKSKGLTHCDPPYCGPCYELSCSGGACSFICVPIPGCTP